MSVAPAETFQPVRDVWQYRHVLGSLTVRELRIRYKQSLLGVG